MSPAAYPGIDDLPCLCWAHGCFPNSQFSSNGSCYYDHYAQGSLGEHAESIVAIGSTNSDNLTDYYLAIAARSPYEDLDKIQCKVLFTPTNFAVNVSPANATISVSPINACNDPEPRGMLRSKVVDSLNAISMVQRNLYVSNVGEALNSNVRNYVSWASRSEGLVSSANGKEVLAAVTDSVEAMADDILESFAAAALTQVDAGQLSQVDFTARGVEIGEYPYIIAVLAYQVVALIGVVAALLLKRFWSHTPEFDYTDIGAFSTAASLGANPTGTALSKAVRGWHGGPDHGTLGLLTFRYRHCDLSEAPIVQISPQQDLNGKHHGAVD